MANSASKNWRSTARRLKVIYENLLVYIRRKWRVLKRKFGREIFANSYHIGIVAVKREPYAELAIANINSLHYLNPTHKFSFYCDDICEKAFKRLFWKLDYPKQVEVVNKFRDIDQPWQYSKLETTIEISRKGWMLVDADALWHHDPIINQDKITLLVNPKKIKDKKEETAIVTNIFQKPQWLPFGYYSSGFISIPVKFMTEKVAEDARKYLRMIMDDNLEFIPLEKDRGDQKRQAEQFALNLSLLSNLGEEVMTVLKEKDGTKDTNLLQSLYYGCARNINE